MATTQQTPAIVIAARNALIEKIGEVAGGRTTEKQRQQVADWLIASGNLSDSYYGDFAPVAVAD